jgi:hypothetical protein
MSLCRGPDRRRNRPERRDRLHGMGAVRGHDHRSPGRRRVRIAREDHGRLPVRDPRRRIEGCRALGPRTPRREPVDRHAPRVPLRQRAARHGAVLAGDQVRRSQDLRPHRVGPCDLDWFHGNRSPGRKGGYPSRTPIQGRHRPREAMEVRRPSRCGKNLPCPEVPLSVERGAGSSSAERCRLLSRGTRPWWPGSCPPQRPPPVPPPAPRPSDSRSFRAISFRLTPSCMSGKSKAPAPPLKSKRRTAASR